MSDATRVQRAAGLPKDGTEGHFFAFDQGGGMWAVEWSKEQKAWVGVGWKEGQPTSLIFRDEAARATIASHVSVPMHLIDTSLVK